MLFVDVEISLCKGLCYHSEVRRNSMGYDVEAIRRKLKQSQAGKYTDPDEFKPA